MREIRVVGAAIVRDGKCLVALRGPGMSTPGKWEFPGGKIDAGETPEVALAREIREELGVEVVVHESLGVGTAIARERRIVLEVFRAALARGTPVAREHSELRWIGAGEIDALTWAAPDVPILPRLHTLLDP